MRAVTYTGSGVRVERVPKARLVDETDVVVKMSMAAICGTDLHILAGAVQELKPGQVLGHEFVGTVVEAGKDVRKLRVGDRVVVSAIISCGNCFFCNSGEYAHCDKSNPKHKLAEQQMGYAGAGIFGFGDMSGGFAGCQAEYVRVPFADVGALKVPEQLKDEEVLFLSDIFPTGWMAAENCDIRKGDAVAVWGCGPVGQFAIRSALLQGAGQVIAIDRLPERLRMAAAAGARTIDCYAEGDLLEELKRLTGGRGPDCCIDAVGMEATHGSVVMDLVDRAKQLLKLESDRPAAIQEILKCVRKGGKVSVPGAYLGIVDNFPLGFAFNKGVTIKTGCTHMQKYFEPLLRLIETKSIDPSFVITHRMKLDDAETAYEIFRDKKDGAIKIVLVP